MVFVDREVDQAAQGITQAQAKFAEMLTKLASVMLERMNEAKQNSESLQPEQQQIVDDLIAQHCMDALAQHGVEESNGEITFESERYSLSYTPDDLSGMPVYSVSDRETGCDCFMFQRHPTSGEFVYFDVESPLTEDQKQTFVNALAQRSTAATRTDRSPIAQISAQLDTYGDLAPKGSKAAVVADALLRGKDTFQGTHYSLQREADGGLSIYRTGNNEQILNLSADGVLKERLKTADVVHFDKMFATFKEMQGARQSFFSALGKTTPGKTSPNVER